ncbi:hypothetical protein DH86_00002693 [Scytalidium sp. 3C]|nr:hypothetical protein DH86_00002693 [Scytalidium sp. 3C]
MTDYNASNAQFGSIPAYEPEQRRAPVPSPDPISFVKEQSTTPNIPQVSNPSNMSTPAPLLRPPIPGSRQNGGARTPRLGLSIPPSPNVKPVGGNGAPLPQGGLTLQMPNQVNQRPPPPRLQLATPMGSNAVPYEQPILPTGRVGYQPATGQSASGGSESSAAHSRTGSFGPLDGRMSNPTSAGSQYSALSLASQYGLRQPQGTPDPASAVGSLYSERSEGGTGMERDGSMNGLEAFDQLSLEKGRTLDVEELDDDGWRQIVRELGFNKDCASEHICRYYGAFVEPSTATISIAMEYCEGGSLDSIYREVKKLGGRTGEKVLGKIAEGVLNGLTYLHSKKIIHRDIKPSNILLCRDGQVKLCDFGVSGEFGTKGDANTFIGTSYYMAPERITGQSYTITSDVWSTGVTLLEVAQHRFPFPADGTEMQPRAGLIDLLTYIVRQPIPKLKDEPENGIKWSDNFKYFIECCLEKEPSRRASPWRMLEHPWMIEMRSKRVNMAHFLATVWGWDENE